MPYGYSADENVRREDGHTITAALLVENLRVDRPVVETVVTATTILLNGPLWSISFFGSSRVAALLECPLQVTRLALVS